jgi:hypothetical protein
VQQDDVGGNWQVKLDMVGEEFAMVCVVMIWDEDDSALSFV